MIALTEHQSDFENVDLGQYTDETLELLLETVETDQRPTPESVTINGRPAIQYGLRGTVDNPNVVYWITNVDGTHNYYQVVAWTSLSKAERNVPIFQEVVQSFREVVK